jgi:hypothetical protein
LYFPVFLCVLCGECLRSVKIEARSHMPRKKKLKPFRAVTAVKELARERVGTPPAEKIVIEKKKKPEKHKPTLSKLLGEPE